MPLNDSVEKSYIGVLEILLHVGNAAFCLGALIASAVALTAINDIIIFDDDIDNIIGDDEDKDHKWRYQAVAWWIIGVGSAGVVLQAIMAVIRSLYYNESLVDNFIAFAIISIIFSIILGFAVIFGGAASTANAVNVNEEYLEKFQCSLIDDYPNPDDNLDIEIAKTLCHNLEKLRICQAASAALAFLGGGAFVLLIAVLTISILRKNSGYQTINS